MNFLRCLLLLLVCVSSYAQQSETKVALVIGNSTYKAAPLKNPANDSRDVAAKLRGLGFTVIERSNLTVKQIGGTLREFRSKLTPGSVALVFYAGHGLQIKGENYLPAVDADISSEEDVPTQSLATKQIMDVLGDAKTRLNLVFLDACRDNPYARGFRSASRGLSKESAPSGTLISFATRPGGVASDGDGRNGLYTSVLLQAMNSTNLPIEQLLKKVVSGVKVASNSKQEPWMEGSIEGDFCFGQCNAVQTAVSDDRALWESVKDSRDVADLRAYVNRFPNGLFAEVAANKIRAIQAASGDQESSARAEQERRRREAAEAAAKKAQSAANPGAIVKDCAECPELVVVPAGNFTMGSSAQEQALANSAGVSAELTARESPQHYVRVPSFAAGRYAVTKGEFAAFVRASNYRTETEHGGGCYVWTGKDKEWQDDADFNWRNAGFSQGDDHPVVCVSWNDVQAYIQWLNRISGKSYRLLSEAEWEYVARGGTQTAFWWGDNVSTSRANYNGSTSYNGSPKGKNRQATVPVQSFSPNPFGLYNLNGNVWELTQDCWHENYAGAPTDGSAWMAGCADDKPVLRGGSWGSTPVYLRSAFRFKISSDVRLNDGGFRLARDL